MDVSAQRDVMHDLRRTTGFRSPEAAVLSSLVSPKGRLGLSKPSWHAECRYAGSSRLQRGQHPSVHCRPVGY